MGRDRPLGSAAVRLVVLVAALGAARAQLHFDAAHVVADDTQRFEAVLDLDADGWADVLSWYWTDDSAYDGALITGWLNDKGQLAPAWSFTVPVSQANPYIVNLTATGDLDGDAREDFAVAFGARVFLWTSNGAAQPTLLTFVSAPFQVDSFVLADIDADGLDDLALADAEKVRLYRNIGAVPWALTSSFVTPGTIPDVLVALDADGDGDDDLADLNVTHVDLYPIQAGFIAAVVPIPHNTTPGGPMALATGDVDGDGDPDLVLFRTDASACGVMLNAGGSFAAGIPQGGGPARYLMDVDFDGDDDGVCCGGGSLPSKNTDPSRFLVSFNDGGDFAPAFQIASLGSAHIAGVADLDHDGDADLVGGRTIYRAAGPLVAAPHATFDSGDGLDIWGGMAAQVGDADGDGDPDIRFGPPSVQVNDGAGHVSLLHVDTPPVPGAKKWLGPGFPGDFDGDGDVDLVVSRWQGLFSGATFLDNWVLRNAGGGLLWQATPATAVAVNMSGAGVPIESWDEPAASLAADADGDGDVDLLVRSGILLGPTTLWLNNGDAFFTQGATWAEGVQAVANLDADALPDLAFTSGGKITLRFGTGGGAFGPPVNLPSAVQGKDGLAVLDLDGDLDLDLVAGPEFVAMAHAWINDGAGGFTLDGTLLADFPLYASSSLPDHFAVLDVDGDGLQDLIAGPAAQAVTASWVMLRNPNGPGMLDGGQICTRIISAADMDGDGDGDLLGQDADFEDVIVRGLRFDGEGAGLRWQFGAGTSGTGGAVPVLGASGPFRVGELATLRMTGLPSGKLGLLTVGQEASHIPGVPWVGSTAYNWPWLTFFFVVSPPGQPGAPGSSAIVLPYLVAPELATAGPLYHQAWFADPAGPSKKVGTNALLLEYD